MQLQDVKMNDSPNRSATILFPDDCVNDIKLLLVYNGAVNNFDVAQVSSIDATRV